jgi:small nuclear ribonucleoprotein (snRNP)-like protein
MLRQSLRCFLSMVILLVLAAPAIRAGDWGSLGRLSRAQTVKVHLRDGRVLRGTVQQVGADSLSLVDEKKLTEIRTRDIESTLAFEDGEVREIKGNGPSIQVGQVVELKMRDGRLFKGSVHEFFEAGSSLRLAQSGAVTDLRRDDVVRVTKKTRWLTAAIGGAAGMSFGFCCVPKDSLAKGESRAKVYAGYLIPPALILAGIGAAIGYNQTIYEVAPNRGQ